MDRGDFLTSYTKDKGYYTPVNWNRVDDYVDIMTYDTLVSQFWTSTRIPVSNDIKAWSNTDDLTKGVVNKVFAELTILDTLQSREGSDALMHSALTTLEEDVLRNIGFMESIHARSYSTIFTTLCTSKEVDENFEWAENNKYVQKKIKLINEAYQSGDILKIQAASVFLESFLFYSGFYTPLRLKDSLKSVLEIIKLILRDESVHGSYIGYKFSKRFEKLSEEEKNETKMWVNNLLFELYQVECEFIEEVYTEIGWAEDVKLFAQYNANKALLNLKLDPIFETTEEDVNPIVMAGLKTSTGNHDFFSQEGNGYLLGKAENTKEEDYDSIDINELNKNIIDSYKDKADDRFSHSYYID
ncbi:ribonucleotide reductase of class Ib (aerobic), beta subunit [Staphylococcus phage PALS_2]|nr:ribonucleotide reductase of class Ib (aerobic), beta subunit [Staphylococcus phage PALS_2]UAJ17179.1 ribonucleoside-diphosphate reductase 2 subunit beta [Staphylococcus phage vB_SauM-UFV_DC4]BDE75560.1 ribonucleoside-diphosphate reductase subunit beta [Staphylococcus phage S6]